MESHRGINQKEGGTFATLFFCIQIAIHWQRTAEQQ